MSLATTIAQYRERATALWLARTEQERRFLAIGGFVVLAAVLYLLLVDPAVEGRANLRRTLPQLRQQAAELQAMARSQHTRSLNLKNCRNKRHGCRGGGTWVSPLEASA